MSGNIQPPAAGSLDGCEFVMVSSTGSEVSAEHPSRFRYRQAGAMVWGEYRGDSVLFGRFAGRRDGDRVTIGFAHSMRSGGTPLLGTATSTIMRGEDGRMLLVEDFDKDGVTQQSICAQVDPTGDWYPPAATDDPLSVDATAFVLVSSTASTVDSGAPTRFDFSERGGILWGDYRGDTVATGHCVGVRNESALNEYFVHKLVSSGATLFGVSSTEVRARDDGQLELVEEFVLNGVPGRSVCLQLSSLQATVANAY